jgi:hypothetical protein
MCCSPQNEKSRTASLSTSLVLNPPHLRRRRLTHAHQPLNPHHPIATLIRSLTMDILLDLAGALKVSALQRPAELEHELDRVVFEQLLVVQVVEEQVEALLGVGHLGGVGGRGADFDAGELRGEDVVYGFCGGGNVRAVAFCWGEISRGGGEGEG